MQLSLEVAAATMSRPTVQFGSYSYNYMVQYPLHHPATPVPFLQLTGKKQNVSAVRM